MPPLGVLPASSRTRSAMSTVPRPSLRATALAVSPPLATVVISRRRSSAHAANSPAAASGCAGLEQAREERPEHWAEVAAASCGARRIVAVDPGGI